MGKNAWSKSLITLSFSSSFSYDVHVWGLEASRRSSLWILRCVLEDCSCVGDFVLRGHTRLFPSWGLSHADCVWRCHCTTFCSQTCLWFDLLGFPVSSSTSTVPLIWQLLIPLHTQFFQLFQLWGHWLFKCLECWQLIVGTKFEGSDFMKLWKHHLNMDTLRRSHLSNQGVQTFEWCCFLPFLWGCFCGCQGDARSDWSLETSTVQMPKLKLLLPLKQIRDFEMLYLLKWRLLHVAVVNLCFSGR